MNETKIIEQKAKQLQYLINKQLPVDAKNLGLQFFQSRFRAQGWLDKGFEKWKPRSPKAKRNEGRAILIDTGRLRNSISGRADGNQIIFGADVPYAKVHNEGGTITRKAGQRVLAFKQHTRGKNKGRTLFHRNNATTTFAQKVNIGRSSFQMPKRQFMGDSEHLRSVITHKIENEIKKLFK